MFVDPKSPKNISAGSFRNKGQTANFISPNPPPLKVESWLGGKLEEREKSLKGEIDRRSLLCCNFLSHCLLSSRLAIFLYFSKEPDLTEIRLIRKSA